MNARDEVILDSGSVRVRIMVLDGGEATAWHFHTMVVDKMLGLEGTFAVEYQGPQDRVELCPGKRCGVAVGRVHRVVNLTAETVKYLLVQGVGRYDFNVVDQSERTYKKL